MFLNEMILFEDVSFSLLFFFNWTRARSFLLCFRFRFVLCDCSNKHLVERMITLSLLECVRGGDCELGAVSAERQRRDRRRILAELTEAFLVGAVPHIDETVAAA